MKQALQAKNEEGLFCHLDSEERVKRELSEAAYAAIARGYKMADRLPGQSRDRSNSGHGRLEFVVFSEGCAKWDHVPN